MCAEGTPSPAGSSRCHNRGIVPSAALVLALVTVAAAAVPSLPTDMPTAQRARLEAVTQAAAVSTSVEAEPFVARAEVFEYLLDHPEFASRVTRALKAARYRIWREADGLHLDDGWGIVGRFDLVYAAGRTRVMHARGIYQKRFLPDIHGEAVVMIEYGFRPAPDGKSLVAATVTGFVRLDSGFLTVATKLATPIARAKADREAKLLVKVFARVSRAADESPAALVQALAHQPDVMPRELAEFRRILNLP